MTDVSLKKVFLYIRYDFVAIRRKVIYELDLHNQISLEEKSISVEFRFGSYSDVSAKEFHNYDIEAKEFAQERLQKGDIIILGTIDGKVICYGWLMYNQMDLSMRDYISLNDGSAYSYKIYITESHRGKGILLAYFYFVVQYLLKEGYSRLITWIDKRNIPSIKSHGKVGFVPIGSIMTLKVMEWNSSFMRGL